MSTSRLAEEQPSTVDEASTQDEISSKPSKRKAPLGRLDELAEMAETVSQNSIRRPGPYPFPPAPTFHRTDPHPPPQSHRSFPNPPPPGFQIPSPPFGSQSEFQLGDLFITPLLAWHRQNFHWAVGGDIVLPTGSWADKRLVNAGQNYLTLSPAVAFTYYPIEGLQFSAKLTVDINFENDDTNYDSGEAFLTDWSTTYTVPTSIGGVDVGLGGYTYNQFTKDTQNGHTVGDGPNLSRHDGFEGQAYGIGPIIGYRHPSGARVEVKYQKDFDVENRPEGSRFFIRAFVRF